ncbi:MAG: nucleotidyltransferase [Chloroflexi bacterium]|nr:nucleotidyltransferase [Chloroflexota bacterium]
MYTLAQTIPKHRLEEFCHRWRIQELALFGSVLRPDFNAGSDVDVLVTFTEDAAWGLLEHIQMELELEHLFEREVDLISRRAVEQSHNWIRRREILDNAQVLFSIHEATYAAG